MHTYLSPVFTSCFSTLVVATALMLLVMLRAGAVRAGLPEAAVRVLMVRCGVVMTAWLFFGAVLATRGMLLDFMSMPPRVGVVIAPALLAAILLPLLGAFDGPLRGMSPAWPIAAQVFRVPVELAIFALYREGGIARMMTFEGSNYDWIAGVTAPVVAWMCFGAGRRNVRLARIWNVLGLVLLANVMLRGMLSAPTSFQVFHTDPPNAMIARYPVVWLPSFLVPMALLLHLLSFRRMALPEKQG